MLLDEPTNHLDLEARNWLETYLIQYPHAVILVSHDRFFLDTVVTNLALALPRRHKVHGLSKKVLLRKAAAPLLPREIVRGKKRGFSIPAAAWLRGELEPFARETLSPDVLRRQGFFRPEVVGRLIDEHVAGREDRSRQLWGLLAFTLWHERHVEREPGEAVRPEVLVER